MTRTLLVVVAVLGLALSGLSPGVAADDQTPVCAECHPDVASGMSGNTHMLIHAFEVGGRAVGCEGCHGDPAKHLESGEAKDIQTFGKEDFPEAVCLECHSTKGLGEWPASTHSAEGVSCVSCHSVHTESQPLARCQGCHADAVGQFQLPHRHPVREGMMTCSSCHNPHMASESHLKTQQRTNELCYDCHQEKEGPFIFEHEPVQEDCMQCHVPHGSVARNLLAVSEPMLCLQCHDFHFHSGLLAADDEHEVGGSARYSPLGEHSFNAAFSTKCTQCHARVHGSDLPSQTVPGGGRGKVR